MREANAQHQGQHFLAAPGVVRRLVAEAALRRGESVLDVGSGEGVLTRALAQAVAPGRVTAIENDPRLAAGLRAERLPGVTVLDGDALQVPLPEIDAVVSNPPFRIAAPMLLRLLEHGFGRALLVLPRELAERLVAAPGSPRYGRLTVQVAARAATDLLYPVPRRAFRPPPTVACAVVRVTPTVGGDVPPTLEILLQTAWMQPRRTNRHALAPLARTLGVPPMAVTEALRRADVEGQTPFDTSPEAFVQAAQDLAARLPSNGLGDKSSHPGAT
ncbi:MAG: rRNA adenine N-6-methyltransferase family protein [Thermoplasmatota archaeon]